MVMGPEFVSLAGLVTLFVTMGLRSGNGRQLLAQVFYHTATTRPPILIVATLAGWAGVMKMSEKCGLKVAKVIGPAAPLKPFTTFRCAVFLFDAILACRLLPIMVSRSIYGTDPKASFVLVGDICAYVCCLVALVMPPSHFCFPTKEGESYSASRSAAHAKYGHGLLAETSHSRDSLAWTLWETLLAPFAPVTFWHVIVADYATSLAKGLGDAHVTACVAAQAFFDVDTIKEHSLWWEARRGSCASSWLNASALALPFWCRLFQCCAAYKETRHPKNLWNALKYATAFPLIYVGYLEKKYKDGYIYLFVAAAILQSSATFFWDIFMDWGLCEKKDNGLFFGLFKPTFRKSFVYSNVFLSSTALVAFDLSLRFLWTLAVFGDVSTRGFGLFIFELAEILRRTVWALFRIEWELVATDNILIDEEESDKKGGPKTTKPLLDDDDDDNEKYVNQPPSPAETNHKVESSPHAITAAGVDCATSGRLSV